MTTTPTSGAAIQRYKIGYQSDEWGQRSSTPSGIPDASGSWVRYADHVTALAAGQAAAAPAQPAAQQPHRSGCTAGTDEECVQRGCGTNCPAVSPRQGAAYAALPEPDIAVGNDGRALIYTSKDIVGEPYYTAGQLRAFADATHALRASQGQAPATAQAEESVPAVDEVAERYRNAIASACEGWTMPDGLRKHLETALWSPPTPQPTQAQATEPVAWLDPWTGTKVTTDYDAYGKHGIPLYAAPQPVAREPLPKFLALKFHARRDKKATVTLLFPGHEAADAWVRGIKGGQHGTE